MVRERLRQERVFEAGQQFLQIGKQCSGREDREFLERSGRVHARGILHRAVRERFFKIRGQFFEIG